MGLQEILGIVKVKCEEAAGLQLAGEDGQAVSMLQQVATIISSEFGATDEVAAASPEGEEPSDEEKAAKLYVVIHQVEELVSESHASLDGGREKYATNCLEKVVELITETLVTESG